MNYILFHIGPIPNHLVYCLNSIKTVDKDAKIILCTPTVIGELVTFKDAMEIKRDQELDAFSGVVRNLASEFNTELLDLRTIFKDYIIQNNKTNDYQGFLTDDGVHLNDFGNQLIAEKMLEYIK